ncbi:Ankyrin-2 [Dactylellina cionopaga]|nr:Ankyrin-2 [Dactylellina cionopaga]
MQLKRLVILSFLLTVHYTDGLDWDGFTNNFATDLAPLITLFGEQVTKQFLSESLSIWDNIIFAMAPLGLLTAVVSAIRVCGTPSMRAFIGRAQESPGTAEVELLSCTSETTAELFNEGGIARVFGEPRILEVMVKASGSEPGKLLLGPFSDVSTPHWKELKSRHHRPNLSLNVGITRLPVVVTYSAAAVGIVLQIGMLVFAALTIYTFPSTFPIPGRQSGERYAFPMTLCGTLLVCFGMFLCAFIIERSTDEIHYKQLEKDPKNKCKIYWVQPGGQSIGDQVFGSFIGYSDNSHYIRSTKSDQEGNTAVLWIAVTTSTVGFVVQFVGLRSMHASVILVQIGATILMAIIRAMLRTQRLDETFGHREKLDGVANYDPYLQYGTGQPRLSNDVSSPIETRQQLANITNSAKGPSWNDLEVRTVAKQLAAVIEGVMEIISVIRGTPISPGSVFKWPVTTKITPISNLNRTTILSNDEVDSMHCQTESYNDTASCENTSLYIEKGDGVSWKINLSQLEALVGLWALSVIIYDIRDEMEDIHIPNSRLISTENSNTTNIWYHVWIQRRLTSTFGRIPIPLIHMGSNSIVDKHLFGRLKPLPLDNLSVEAERVLHVETQNSTIQMCAQDMFMFFLHSALKDIPEIGGKTETRDNASKNSVTMALQNSSVEGMADLFEVGGLGSREDAYMCIFPVLRGLDKMPKVDGVFDAVVRKSIVYRNQERWSDAEDLLQWLYSNPAIMDNIRASEALAEFYYTAILRVDIDTQTADLGFTGICQMMVDKTSSYTEQMIQEYGWIGLRIADERGLIHQRAKLLFSGVKEDLVPDYQQGLKAVEWAKRNSLIMLKYLVRRSNSNLNEQDESGFTPLVWALKNKNGEMAKLLLLHNADKLLKDSKGRTAASHAAENGVVDILKILLMDNITDLHTADVDGISPLMYAVYSGNLGCFRCLLGEKYLGIDKRNNRGESALHLAASKGYVEMVELLLVKGADGSAGNSENQTALHVAADGGYDEVIRLLLNYPHLDVEQMDKATKTPLDLASERGYPSTVSILLEHDARPFQSDWKTQDDRSAMRYAGRGGHLGVLKLLFGSRKRPSAETNALAWIHNKAVALQEAMNGSHEDAVRYLMDPDAEAILENASGKTILQLAARTQSLSIVKLVLNMSALAKKSDKSRALHTAAGKGNIGIIKFLLEQGVDVNSEGTDGGTILHIAARRGDQQIAEFLLQSGATANARTVTRQTALHFAALNKRTEIIRLLLRYGADVHALSSGNKTALLFAAEAGTDDGLQALIESGADVNTVTDLGETALSVACGKGRKTAVCVLLEHGGRQSVNKRSVIEQKTPLFVAVSHKADYASIVKQLLNAGAETNFKDTEGRTALFEAARRGHCDSIKFMLEAGIEIDTRDISGKTALFSTIETGQQTAANLLIDAGADVNARDTLGFTPLFDCLRPGEKYIKMARLFLEKGANVDMQDKDGESLQGMAERKGLWAIRDIFVAQSQIRIAAPSNVAFT